MRRVGRIVFGGAAVVSAGVALLVAVAWGVGKRRAVYVTGMTRRTSASVGVCRGCVEVARTNMTNWEPGWDVQTLSAREAEGALTWDAGGGPAVAWRCGRAEWARCDVVYDEDHTYVATRSLIVPYWPLMVGAMVLPGAWGRRWAITRRRQGGRGFQVEGLRAED